MTSVTRLKWNDWHRVATFAFYTATKIRTQCCSGFRYNVKQTIERTASKHLLSYHVQVETNRTIVRRWILIYYIESWLATDPCGHFIVNSKSKCKVDGSYVRNDPFLVCIPLNDSETDLPHGLYEKPITAVYRNVFLLRFSFFFFFLLFFFLVCIVLVIFISVFHQMFDLI